MNKLFFSALIFSVLSLFSISAYSGEVAIIVNKNNDASISDAELRNLFLGKVRCTLEAPGFLMFDFLT